MPVNEHCRRCSLHETTGTVCIWGVGPKHADIMLIGEAPGADEEEQREPFVGASGKVINRLLKQAGLKRSQVYITNIVKCRPPGNRDPLVDEVGACLPYLLEEIMTVKPKVIVLVGLQAVKALTSEGALNRARGKLLQPKAKIRIGDAKMIATFHPAGAMYQGSKRQQIFDSIAEDFGYAKNLASPKTVTGTRTLLPEGYTLDQLRDALMTLRKAHELSCDLEWLAPIRSKSIAWPWTPKSEMLSVSLSARIDGEVSTVAFAWPTGLMRVKVRALLNSFLKNRSIFNHNIQADAIWLLAQGIDFTISGDTMLLAYLLDEHRRAGLKGLAPLVAGVESGWEQKPWHRRPATERGWLELLRYNGDDTENTLLLHEALLAQLQKLPRRRRNNLLRVYQALLVPAIKPFARIALAGVPINRRRLARQVDRQERLYRKAISRLAKITGLREDAAERLANSPEQVKRYAREMYGLEVDSSREEELGEYAEQYPALKYIKEIKHRRKMKSTYLEPWQRLILAQGDDRLHSVYLLGATRTGRLSAEVEEGGSLLLTPRELWVRDLIDAENEDDEYEILAADYSQLELRIAAWLFPERTLRRLYNEGVDVHRATAAYMIAKREAGVDFDAFWRKRDKWMKRVDKEDRQKAKGQGFGLLYGMQEKHFRDYVRDKYQVTMTEQEAHTTYDEHFNLYTDLKPAHERLVRDSERLGYTLTPFGRYRYGVEPTQAINTPIQSTGSDLAIFALTLIDERFEAELDPSDAQLVGFVHDAVLVRSRKSKRDIVQRIISECMEHPDLDRVGIGEIPVPLVAEVQHGPTWAKVA